MTVINNKMAKSYSQNASVLLQKSASYTLPLATVFRPRKRESGETIKKLGVMTVMNHKKIEFLQFQKL